MFSYWIFSHKLRRSQNPWQARESTTRGRVSVFPTVWAMYWFERSAVESDMLAQVPIHYYCARFLFYRNKVVAIVNGGMLFTSYKLNILFSLSTSPQLHWDQARQNRHIQTAFELLTWLRIKVEKKKLREEYNNRASNYCCQVLYLERRSKLTLNPVWKWQQVRSMQC